jgi:TrmH family RNA methyltransferase
MPFTPLTKSKLKQFERIREKKFRQSSKLFPIEGIHLLEEFLKSKFQAAWVVVDSSFEKEYPRWAGILRKDYAPITFQATRPELNKISDTEHPQGIVVAVHKVSSPESLLFDPTARDLIVVLDGISDPGNLGTIMRSADWFGVRKIVLSESCVEVHNPKVVRASMGSIFRMACFESINIAYFLEKIKLQNYVVCGATTAGTRLEAVPEKSVLVIGSESHGISEALRGLCDREIKIPKYGHGESLNAAVACSILLYEFARSSLR